MKYANTQDGKRENLQRGYLNLRFEQHITNSNNRRFELRPQKRKANCREERFSYAGKPPNDENTTFFTR